MKTIWRSPFLTLVLLAIDAIVLALLWLGVYDLRANLSASGLFSKPINPKDYYADALPLLLVAWLFTLAHFKFYSHHERIAGLNRLGPIVWSLLWFLFAIAIYNFTHKSTVQEATLVYRNDFGRSVIGMFLVATGCYLFVSRTAFRIAKRWAVERGHGRVRVLVVGAGELGRETLARVREHPDIGFKVVGFVAAEDRTRREGEQPEEIEGYPVLGGLGELVPIVQRHQVEEVFLAVAGMEEDDVFQRICDVQHETQAVVKVVANMLYVIVNRAKVDEVIGLPVVAFRGSEFYPAHLLAKRVADVVLASAALLVLAPISLLFAILIKLDSRGPVLFVHERVGLNGRRFEILKFRTMSHDAQPYAQAPSDQSDPRITRFGRFLRRTSLDEIPQMLNVLRGEMSLVGPRPEMPFIAETYSEWQSARLRVKPGVTGLWQVSGRKNLPLHFNLEYDFYYVSNQSIALDVEILLRTVPAVFFGKGAF